MQLIIGITFDFCIPKILTFAGEKDKNMKYRKTHLINEHCDCQVVETRNADEKIRRLNESTNSTYHIDVD